MRDIFLELPILAASFNSILIAALALWGERIGVGLSHCVGGDRHWAICCLGIFTYQCSLDWFVLPPKSDGLQPSKRWPPKPVEKRHLFV